MEWPKAREDVWYFYALKNCKPGVTHLSQAWRGSCQRRWRWLKPLTVASGRRAWWRSAPWSEDEAPAVRLPSADTAEKKKNRNTQSEFSLKVTDCFQVIRAILLLFKVLSMCSERCAKASHSTHYLMFNLLTVERNRCSSCDKVFEVLMVGFAMCSHLYFARTNYENQMWANEKKLKMYRQCNMIDGSCRRLSFNKTGAKTYYSLSLNIC